MKKIIALVLSLLTISAYAQEKTVTTPDPDWGENQHLQERAAYWHNIDISGPDTNIPEARIRGYNQFISLARPKGMMIQSATAWEQVGGSQEFTVSGRPTSIAFDPISTQIFYLGTSGGGLWKTTNGGLNWVSLSDTWSSYAMGGVAVDYSDRNTIYAATGDLYDRPGDGLYKSTDGGLNWVHYAVSNTIGTQCNQVLIDPQVNTTIYVTSSNGVSRSLDAGVTWKKILSIGGTTHMVIDPTNGQNLYAGGGGPGSGTIRKSTDGGNTWSGDVASNISGKFTITLAISKNNPAVIYASLGSSGGGSLGVGRSSDNGSTWKLVWNQANYMSQQAFYDNACAVSPSNENNVVVGGLDIWGSTNGGSNLSQRTQWTAPTSAGNFTHADIHVLAYNPLGNGLYALTDGGIFFSANNGSSWQQNKNTNLSTMLFVGGDASADFSIILGGAQDNGINRALEKDKAFQQTHGGDGGRCFIGQSDPNVAYSTYINASLQKSGDGGISWDPGPNGNYNIIPFDSPLLREPVGFYMNYDVSESDGAVLGFVGNPNVYYSSNGGNTIDPITKSNSINGGPRCVHVAGADPNVVYVGSGSGFAFMNSDAGNLTTTAWVKSTTKIGIASGFVTDPADASKVWACISGFGSGNKHFWRSLDFGKTWDAPATNLPDLDASTIARAPNGDLFIGTTFGVLYSKDNGVNWAPLRDGIPLTQVTKLRVRGTNNQWLLATTYGRGMYRINISDLPPVVPNDGVVASSKPSADMPAITSISPNPVQINGHTKIAFRLAKESAVSIILFNELGREVKTLLKEIRPQGDQVTEADISTLPSGAYYAVLTSDGHAVTQKFVIAK